MLTLTLKGEEVDLPPRTDVSLSYQVHDLGSTSTREADYSETFTLPRTHRNMRVLGIPHSLDSDTDAPYTFLPAVLSQNDVLLLDGMGILEQSADGFDITLVSKAGALFSLVSDKQLRELDLSAFDHRFTLDSVQQAQKDLPEAGYTYPLVDDGRFTVRFPVVGANSVHYTELSPAVFSRIILAQLVSEALPGFTVAGSMVADPKFQRHQLLGGALGPQRRQSYLDALRAEAMHPERQYYGANVGDRLEQPLPFTEVVADPGTRILQLDGATSYTLPDETADYRVELSMSVSIGGDVPDGAGEQIVELVIVEDYNTLHTETLFKGQWTTNNPTARLLKGVQLDTVVERVAGGGPLSVILTIDNGLHVDIAADARLVITPQPRAYNNSPVHLDAGLPDMSQQEFLQLLFNTFGGFAQVDPARKLVRFDLFNDLRTRKPKDWSRKVDFSQRPIIRYRLDGLAQRNTLAYAEAPGGYDVLGSIPTEVAPALVVTDNTLAAETDAYVAPVCSLRPIASFRRTVTLPFLAQFKPDDLLLFEVWRPGLTWTTDVFTLDQGRYWKAKSITTTRPDFRNDAWELVKESEVFPSTEGKGFAALFATQDLPATVGVGDNGGPVWLPTAGVTFEELSFAELLPAYYQVQQRALSRVRVLELGIRLNAVDIATLDFTEPIRLDIPHWPGYGPLQADFYLQLVNEYHPGSTGPVPCTLIALNTAVVSSAAFSDEPRIFDFTFSPQFN